MLVWNKSIEGLPPHQKSVFGWNAKRKVWIRNIWWDKEEDTWNTDGEGYAKDEISHWMFHPSAPEGELEDDAKEKPKMAVVPVDADLEWWLYDQTSQMDEVSRANILAIDNPDGMHQFGFSVGMGIRNYYGLWHENGLTRYFNNVLGVYHADDMSGVLLEALWHRVHNKPYDPTPMIEKCRKHWKQSGCNMKGEQINAKT